MVITKKQIRKFSIFAVIFAFCFVLMLPTGEAARSDGLPQAMVDAINDGVITTIKENLTSNNEKNYLYTFIMSSTEGEGKGAKPTVITAFANATKVVCGFVIIILAVTRYFMELDKGHDPVEGIYKMLAEIFLVAIFMINIDLVLDYIIKLGEWFINVAIGLGEDKDIESGLTLEMVSGASSGNIFWWIQCVVMLFLPWVCTMLMQVVALFNCFSILIELGIRKAFAPVAVCDIYGEGLRSPGVRYLKRFFATFIKIVICVLVCYIGQKLMGAAGKTVVSSASPLVEVFAYMFKIIAINFTVLGVMNKTGEYANDIVGV